MLKLFFFLSLSLSSLHAAPAAAPPAVSVHAAAPPAAAVHAAAAPQTPAHASVLPACFLQQQGNS